MLLHATDQVEARDVAERLREGVAALSLDIDGQALRFTISIGLAPLAKGDLRASVDTADRALYRAKRMGRNVVSTAAEGAVGAPPLGLRPA